MPKQKLQRLCLKPCEYMTASNVCSRTPCPYGRELAVCRIPEQKKDTAQKLDVLMYLYGLDRKKLCRNAHISPLVLDSIMNGDMLLPVNIRKNLSEYFKISEESFVLGNPIKYLEKEKERTPNRYTQKLPFIYTQ